MTAPHDGAVGDARKRAAEPGPLPDWDGRPYWPGQHHTHHDPAVRALIEQAERRGAEKALQEFADTRGVNVGDEDGEWWAGYRQAQRECLHDAVKAADRIGGTR